MRKLLIGLLLILAVSVSAGELRYTAVSATATSQTLNLNVTTILMVNDGANEIYFRVFDQGTEPSAATTSNAELKSGESVEINRTAGIGSVSIVCAAAETATVRLFY